MGKKITRRDFLKKSTQIGVASTLGGTVISQLLQGPFLQAAPGVDIAVAKGSDYLKGTALAVELLGGMSNFVPKGSKVAILPNTQRNNPGAFTKPEIVRATIPAEAVPSAPTAQFSNSQPHRQADHKAIMPTDRSISAQSNT